MTVPFVARSFDARELINVHRSGGQQFGAPPECITRFTTYRCRKPLKASLRLVSPEAPTLRRIHKHYMTDEITGIKKWLETHGARLELAVGRILRTNGWQARHGGYFVDLTSSQTRDLDVRASLFEGSSEHNGVVTVVLAIECKQSSNKPWVAFTSSEHVVDSTYEYALAPGNLSQVALLYATPAGTPMPAMLQRPVRLAHGLTTAHTDSSTTGPTDAYSSIRGAVAAAAALTRRREAFQRELARGYGLIDIVLPTVVFDGHLFELYIDEAGSEVIEACKVVRVVMPDPLTENGTVICTVFTLAGLNDVAGQLAADARGIASNILPHARKLCEGVYRSGPIQQIPGH